jgi:hypothetical protein
MKTEFIFSRKNVPEKEKENIVIKQKADRAEFYFFNKEKYELALTSKDFISDFYEFLMSRKEVLGSLKIRGQFLDFEKIFSNEVLDYVNNMHYIERKEIIKSLNKLSQKYNGLELANKLSLFLVNLKKLSKQYKIEGKHTPIQRIIKTLESGRLIREEYLLSPPRNQSCKESYLGFLRAIRANTLTTAKVTVDGKEKRMFMKSSAGVAENPHISKQDIRHLKDKIRTLNNGHNPLAIDPDTFELYEITTKSGKHYAQKSTPVNDLVPKDKEAVKKLLRTELKGHLDKIYAKRDNVGKILVPGIERMKKIHKRMSRKRPL